MMGEIQPEREFPMSVFVLVLLPAAAHAVTAHVCIRNDGAGTFQPGSLSIFADTQGSENDASASGPASAMGPGGHGCVDITGLRRTDISYPDTAYTFTVSWTDTNGSASSGSGSIVLDVDKYVGQGGAHSYYLDPSSYIPVSNAAPGAPEAPVAAWEVDAGACLVSWSAPATAPQDFGTWRLERTDASGVWTELDAWQHLAPYTRTDTTLTGDGDARYRVIAEDWYGARSEGAEGACAGSDAAGDGGGTGEDGGTGSGEGTGSGGGTGGDDGDSGGSGSPDSGEGTADSGGSDTGRTHDDDDDDDDDDRGCTTGGGPAGAWLLGLVLLGARRRAAAPV